MCAPDIMTTGRPDNHKNPAKYPQVFFLNFTSDLSPQRHKKDKKPKRHNAYRVNGVNILNRTDLDCKTVIERMERRRENHNDVERKRRYNMNHTILQLAKVIPEASELGSKGNKGKILQMALAHIKALQAENTVLRERVESSIRMPSPPFIPASSNTSNSPRSCLHTATSTATTTTNLVMQPTLPSIDLSVQRLSDAPDSC